MRGKLIDHGTECICNRITPADAGKTKSFLRLYMLWQDHPRGCGENNICW